MSEQVRYITNEQGERVGVLLDLEAYSGNGGVSAYTVLFTFA